MVFGVVDVEEIVGPVGIMGAMAKSLNVGHSKLETNSGHVGVGSGSIGSAMMGHCLHQ